MEIAFAPLGDQAVLAQVSNEEAAFAVAETARSANWPWLVDVVSAYTSVAIFYELGTIDYDGAVAALQSFQGNVVAQARSARLHVIPCSYERGLDLTRISQSTALSAEEIITLHTGTIYTVYAIGFCPGFPYLGYLPEELAHVPRLETPRLKVEAGSVGLTGRQTGIYTEARPGGWNILGQTPLELVNVKDGYFPLRSGDRVRFARIDEAEFEKRLGERLPLAA